MDRITNLPSAIIETILCLVPIQEAARTSILAKEWRHYWTKLPKLVFNEETFQVSTTNVAEMSDLEQTSNAISERKEMTNRCKFFYAIRQVLLRHQGPIHEFNLSMEEAEDVDTSVEVDHLLIHLSNKNTVKKLTLALSPEYIILSLLYLLHQLTDLCLHKCEFYLHPAFNGFGSLKSLYMEDVYISKKTLLHLLSSCPLLKSLSLNIDDGNIIDINNGNMNDIDDSTIIDLFECLPVIEDLCIWFWIIEPFVLDEVPKKLPDALVHLKYLCMQQMNFSHIYGLPFLALLIRSSPNLKKLKLEISDIKSWRGSCTVKDYSDMWLEHMNEFEIVDLTFNKTQLDFVKLILAKSPVLKRVRIFLCHDVVEDVKMQILATFLSSPRASPMVEIIVDRALS